MRRIILAIAATSLLGIVLVLFAWKRFTSFLESPMSTSGDARVVVIPRDASMADVIEILDSERLVSRKEWLKIYVKRFRREEAMKPGEYLLSPRMAPAELFHVIAAGNVITYEVSIAPGLEATQIAGLLAEKGLGDERVLVSSMFDARIAESLGVAGASLEGYLFPDVYELPRGLPAKELLGVLVERYHRVVTPEIIQGARSRGLTEHELVTLASLIERSEILPAEWKLYSAVLHNRLRAGLPLASMASAAYGFRRLGIDTDPVGSERLEHAWNTTTRRGLPPTPIASPGVAAIVAAAEPAMSKAVHMVRKPDKTHVFCDDEESYRAALQEWPAVEAGAAVTSPPRADRGPKSLRGVAR